MLDLSDKKFKIIILNTLNDPKEKLGIMQY